MNRITSFIAALALVALPFCIGTASCANVVVDGEELQECPALPQPDPGVPSFCKPCEDLEMVLSAVESPAQSWCPMLAPGHDMCPTGTQPWICEQYQDMRPEGCIQVLNGYNGLSVQCCGLPASVVTVNCTTDADCHLPVGDHCFINACVFISGQKQCALAPRAEGAPCEDDGALCQEQYDGIPESVYCPSSM